MVANDATERTVESATNEIDIGTVIEEVMDEFGNIASITVDHDPSYQKPTIIRITVYTGEADSFEEHIQLFSPETKIAIEKQGETVLASVTVTASYDGPTTWDTDQQTTIYVSDDVRGADPVQLDNGVAYLRDKLENPDQWSVENSLQLDRIRDYSE